MDIATLTAPVNGTASLDASDVQGRTAETEAELRKAAAEFESVFVKQMLQFAGLGEALGSSVGPSSDAFVDLVLEKIADDIVADGGFGLADDMYKSLQQRSGVSELGRL